MGEEESAPIVKRIRLDEGSEGLSEGEEEQEGVEAGCGDYKQAEEEEKEVSDTAPPSSVKKSKRLKVSDYVDSTLKRSSLTPMTSEIRGGVKRKVSSSRKSLVRALSSKKVRGSTVVSSQFEKAERKRRRRTLN